MKVLVFTTQFFRMNGAERLAVELAEELNSRGVCAHLLSMYSEKLPGVAKARQALCRRGIPAIHFLGMRIHPPVSSALGAVRELRRLIDEEQYDVVETSMLSPTVLAAWATRGGNARHVAGLHHVFTRGHHNRWNHRVWRMSIRLNKHIRFYAVSECARGAWSEYSRTPLDRTTTVYNGIPDECFLAAPDRDQVRRELAIRADGRIALFVGRLMKAKGIDTILDALGPILREENVYVVYAGSSEHRPDGFFEAQEGLLDRLKKRVVAEGWQEHVRFAGRRTDVPRLMASADLLVHPARIEAFGLILAEAMAAGLPVVASDVQGIPEVLAQTDSIMVPPNDPQAVRAAVLKTLQRPPEDAARAIAKGKRRAEAFRATKRTDALLELFRSLLAG